ncbi:hypothetical protein ES703_10277 [subsurface metagenome]
MPSFGEIHRSVSKFDHMRGKPTPNQENFRRDLLAHWQSNNCSRCKFADQSKVGTGEPCCTYPGLINQAGPICYSRREGEGE